MSSTKLNLLVATDDVNKENIARLSRYSTVFSILDLDEPKLAEVLPKIDVLLVFSWPKQLTPDNLRIMSNLKFVQSILAGVNHIPFPNLGPKVTVSSNAGAYSSEVAEYAMALLFSAAKRVVELDILLREEKWALRRTLDKATEVTILRDRVLGILGFGGIGNSVAELARGFGLKIYAYSRKPKRIKNVTVFTEEEGLVELLKASDAVLLALPLTNQTAKIINRDRLLQMKPDAILVNIARGELVDEKALYDHLVANPSFRYATDVWWYRDSKESLKTDYPFLSLPNFIGTPHVSGPSGLATGKPAQFAVDNTLRFLRGLKPHNVVDRNEYTTSYPY